MVSLTVGVSLTKLQEIVKDRKPWHAAVQKVKESDTNETLNSNNVPLSSENIVTCMEY